MYFRPEGERLSFGDVIEADWLFDVYLRPDAVSLHPEVDDVTGRVVRFTVRGAPPRKEQPPQKDAIAVAADFSEPWALAFGNNRLAIVLTDDCELETIYGRDVPGEGGPRKPRGRVLMAAIRAAGPEEVAGVRPGNASAFALPASEGPAFPGAIVELGRSFTVGVKSLLEHPDYRKVVSLDDEAKISLAQRWSAYATRHGPLVALAVGAVAGKLLEADGDPDRVAALRPVAAAPSGDWAVLAGAVASALTSAWHLEGPLGDRLLEEWEAGDPIGDDLATLVTLLATIRAASDAALGVLGEPTWGSRDP